MTTIPQSALDLLASHGVAPAPIPTLRPRRLRSTPAMRALVSQHRIDPAKLILPVFVREDISEPQAISAMPGVYQNTLDSLRREAVAKPVWAQLTYSACPRCATK